MNICEAMGKTDAKSIAKALRLLGYKVYDWEEQMFNFIHYFPIVHNALCSPPKFCLNNCCEILLGGLHIAKSIPQQ